MVSVSLAAITEHHALRGLNHTYLLLTILEVGWKSEIKVSAESTSPGSQTGPLWSWPQLACPGVDTAGNTELSLLRLLTGQ